jgi:hypothetical protein
MKSARRRAPIMQDAREGGTGELTVSGTKSGRPIRGIRKVYGAANMPHTDCDEAEVVTTSHGRTGATKGRSTQTCCAWSPSPAFDLRSATFQHSLIRRAAWPIPRSSCPSFIASSSPHHRVSSLIPGFGIHLFPSSSPTTHPSSRSRRRVLAWQQPISMARPTACPKDSLFPDVSGLPFPRTRASSRTSRPREPHIANPLGAGMGAQSRWVCLGDTTTAVFAIPSSHFP